MTQKNKALELNNAFQQTFEQGFEQTHYVSLHI